MIYIFYQQAFSSETLTHMIGLGTEKIRAYIRVMKSYVRTVVWGETSRGGYGLDMTPEGVLRARALINGNSFLYRGGVSCSTL